MPMYYIPKQDFVIIRKIDIEPYLNAASSDQVKYLIALVWLSGCRVSEIVELKKASVNIDYERKEVTLLIKAKKRGKMGFPSFNFDDPWVSELVSFIPNQGEKVFLYSKRFYQLCLAKLNKQLWGEDKKHWITFHQMRHSRLTYLGRILKATPEEMKSWTGHRANTFEEYWKGRRVDRFRGQMG